MQPEFDYEPLLAGVHELDSVHKTLLFSIMSVLFSLPATAILQRRIKKIGPTKVRFSLIDISCDSFFAFNAAKAVVVSGELRQLGPPPFHRECTAHRRIRLDPRRSSRNTSGRENFNEPLVIDVSADMTVSNVFQ
jgi:hypothetical protein